MNKQRTRAELIKYLQTDYGLKTLWNEDEFEQIPSFTTEQLEELVTERENFYNGVDSQH